MFQTMAKMVQFLIVLLLTVRCKALQLEIHEVVQSQVCYDACIALAASSNLVITIPLVAGAVSTVLPGSALPFGPAVTLMYALCRLGCDVRTSTRGPYFETMHSPQSFGLTRGRPLP
eukprot:TRINITY_DN2873_c0_g1_i1.p1 TRINITY_DN2873_c0_g1~~TRINITY_DN2873_c0_g1_i1.p1  ORF type:complete len:117 (-),score=1.12 TRINITY_DN2873_c0_g1_i1:158-508(-)